MKQFVNWEYYSSLFDRVKENDFDRAERLAENEVSIVVGIIHYSHIDEDDPGFEQLQLCICKTMDKMAEQAESAAGKGIGSISNDGYSESYVVQTQEQATAELRKCIRQWLSGTGIVRAY